MTRRSGSQGSREARRAQRERSQKAAELGLPQRSIAPRAEVSNVSDASLDGNSVAAVRSDARAVKAGRDTEAAAKRGLPLLFKVVVGALLLLAGAYFVSRQRDARTLSPNPPGSAAASPASESRR